MAKRQTAKPTEATAWAVPAGAVPTCALKFDRKAPGEPVARIELRPTEGGEVVILVNGTKHIAADLAEVPFGENDFMARVRMGQITYPGAPRPEPMRPASLSRTQ